MNKQDLWRLYVSRNPSFEGNGLITISAAGLRKLFEQTYDQAHSHGVTNGRAIEKMAQQNEPKKRFKDPKDTFREMFGQFAK